MRNVEGYINLILTVTKLPKEDLLILTERDLDAIDEILKSLKPTKRIGRSRAAILKLRFGLEGKPLSLEETGERFKVCTSRIRTHVIEGLNSLRASKHMKIFRKFFITREEEPKAPSEIQIMDLDFSEKTSSALIGAGILTLNDLKKKNPRELLMLPRFGRKNLKEVEKII